jgi:Icc-related predicted phosphoesterase
MELSKEEMKQIEHKCLHILRDEGITPVGEALVIESGSLGIRKLGCVDFLVKCGYYVRWHRRERR